jgi:hypothetical protein
MQLKMQHLPFLPALVSSAVIFDTLIFNTLLASATISFPRIHFAIIFSSTPFSSTLFSSTADQVSTENLATVTPPHKLALLSHQKNERRGRERYTVNIRKSEARYKSQTCNPINCFFFLLKCLIKLYFACFIFSFSTYKGMSNMLGLSLWNTGVA